MNTRSCRRAFVSVLAISSLFVLSGSLFPQGTLAPPGAPAPTMKTLDQLDAKLEPRIAVNAANTPGDATSLFKITQPGSYYLTGNIAGVSGKHGIAIASSGVTLDLNGFEVVGVAGSLDGVSSTVMNLANIAVTNGTVRKWGGDGINFSTSFANNCRVMDVSTSDNTGNGLHAARDLTAVNCAARNNASNGIMTVEGAISNCQASGNSGTGIVTFSGAMISNCVVSGNSTGGISTGGVCTVLNCTVSSTDLNSSAIDVGYGCTVSNCAASGAGTGIRTGPGCTVSNCTVRENFGNGILANSDCLITDSTVSFNSLDGIICVAGCLIRGNSCSSNGKAGFGSGIHTTGGENRLEGNNCSGADRGVTVDAPGNFIVKNTCSGNTTDWVLAAGNVFGPIVDRRSFLSSTVNGFSATSTLGTTEPNANFSY